MSRSLICTWCYHQTKRWKFEASKSHRLQWVIHAVCLKCFHLQIGNKHYVKLAFFLGLWQLFGIVLGIKQHCNVYGSFVLIQVLSSFSNSLPFNELPFNSRSPFAVCRLPFASFVTSFGYFCHFFAIFHLWPCFAWFYWTQFVHFVFLINHHKKCKENPHW